MGSRMRPTTSSGGFDGGGSATGSSTSGAGDDPGEGGCYSGTLEEMVDARSVVMAGTSTLQKARAPMSFADDVTGTIEKRSAGRFFGRRTFGDRVPFVAILIVALLGLGIIAYIMWRSPTGSLKVDKDPKAGAQGSAIIDKP